MEALWRRYGPRGVQVLGVNIQDRWEDALAFEREFGITFPSVFDPSAELAAKYGVAGIPTMIVIDRGGRIRYAFPGGPDHGALNKALDQVLEPFS